MLTLIRQVFPLDQNDKRHQKVGKALIQGLQRIYQQLKLSPKELNAGQKKQALALLDQVKQLVGTP